MSRLQAAVRYLCVLSIAASIGYAQSNLASISGVVSDPQGAVIPQAKVTATNTATGVRTTVSTNGAGFYDIQNLSIGSYSLAVEHTGFRGYVRRQITLTTGQSLHLDVRLELGAVGQEISVVGEPPPLDTRTSDVSRLVESKSIEACRSAIGGR